jgi:hypothetical protein
MSLILDGTNGLSDIDGSASTPAIRGTDTNTGIFFGSDIIGFSEGGAEVARFNADAQFVAAAGTASLPVITTTGDVNTGIFFPAADTIAFAEGGAEAMRIDSSGNLLVAATTAGLNVSGNGFALQNFNAYSVLSIGHVSGTGSGAQFAQFSFNGTGIGSITQNGTTAVAYNTSSDYRLKENIAPMTGALAKVSALKPVTYTWKADNSDGQGFIAHELAEVVPDCVTGEKDAVDAEGNPQYQGIDVSFLVATLTAAIQEQQAIITDLKARIETLEAK